MIDIQINKFISPFIASQFPAFYNQEGPNFIAFVQAYYEWLEQPDGITYTSNNVTYKSDDVNVVYQSRSLLEYNDIDQTLDQFLIHFKNSYINSLPESALADKRLLVKHILNLYRSKGSARSYDLLFRLLFNENVELYYPRDYILKLSDGTWKIPTYIEIDNGNQLNSLIGQHITTTTGSAVVESAIQKNINGRIINIVYIVEVTGVLKYGQQIQCNTVNLNPLPVISGSLTTVSVVNGGAGFTVGDKVGISASGSSASGVVLSTANQSGTVSFNLQNGGYGYTTNAIVSVTGGGSFVTSPASFSVGGLINTQTVTVDITDTISPYYNTYVEEPSKNAFSIGVSTNPSTIPLGTTVSMSANVVLLDCSYLNSTTVLVGDTLANTTYNISGLYVYRSEGSMIWLTSNNTSDANLSNINLKSKTILNATSGGSILINTVWPKSTKTATGNVSAVTSTTITCNNASGYFIPSAKITNTTTYSANITSVSRLTSWANTDNGNNSLNSYNLDSIIGTSFTYTNLTVGSIAYLFNTFTGAGYTQNPVVTITDPYMAQLNRADGFGGIQGSDAVVTASASSSNGTITGLKITDSGFGFLSGLSVNIQSANNLNQSVATGIGIVDTNGIGNGYWKNNKSFVSDLNYLQDSYFYQNFSYQIIASRMLNTYEKLVRELIHPSGVALFGKFRLKTEFANSQGAVASSSFQQPIS
jgi:hypothetical protein